MVLAEADCVVLPSFYREGALMLRWLLVKAKGFFG